MPLSSSRTDISEASGAALDGTTLETLGASLRGPVIRPGDEGYDAARSLWNGMIDRRPAAIARCTGPVDVRAAVDAAREHGLELAVRGGGHNVAGRAMCDGGLVVDLSPLRGIRVDPASRTVRAQAGVTLGGLDRETHAYGLATTGGVVSTTGIAGLTLGGGVGWLMGKYGLACDNMLSVDVVTADAEFVTASAEVNPDLFWGLRGGGGNFGVATSFEYRLHPVDTVLGGMVAHPMSAARDVLRFFRDLTAEAPDELTTYAGFNTSPEGDPMAVIIVCWCGDLSEGERVVEPIRRFGSPAADLIQPMPYPVQQSLFDEAVPHGQRSYWKAGQLSGLTDEAIDTMVAEAERVTSPRTVTLIEHHHGAMSRVAPGATAFPHREAPYELVTLSLWVDPAESDRHIAWTRGFFQAMQPHFRGGVYVNALGDDESNRVREAYGPNYERLVALKDRWDPTNLFHHNHNIAPSASRAA